jgi:hypothetical protein
MASGDVVGIIQAVMPPAANSATPDVRTGGSTPGEQFVVWDFDASADEYMDYLVSLQGYAGGGLTVTMPWSASTGVAALTCQMGLAVRALVDDAEDVDSSHTYLFNTVIDVAPSAAGEVTYPTVTFTDGADMDSWADGQLAIVRARRYATLDTLTGDAELWGIVIKET